jgi:N-acetylneuraminate synthase
MLVRRLKIASGEITNGPLLLAHARLGLPIILSTGMATLEEVREALAVLAFGLVAGAEPSRAAFERAFASGEGQAALRRQVTLLHCTTEYPAPFDEVNLRAIETLRAAFGLPVGLSDHSVGIAVPIAAAALGAAIVEKHFTLDRTLPGPDHAASLEPGELGAMVEGIRAIEAALGDGVKAPRGAERRNMAVARRSLVAARPIAAGERFAEDSLAAKRPAGGLSPMRTWDLLGSAATRAYRADEAIE